MLFGVYTFQITQTSFIKKKKWAIAYYTVMSNIQGVECNKQNTFAWWFMNLFLGSIIHFYIYFSMPWWKQTKNMLLHGC